MPIEHYFHYVYKIKNISNGMFYIGMHNTSKLRDNYMGSGTNLHKAMRLDGKDNFVKEILQFFDSKIEANEYEILLTTKYFKHPMCYNMKIADRIIVKKC